MVKKKYGLHCFGCGQLFYNKEEVHRIGRDPYCECCWADHHTGIAEQQEYDWEMKKWQESHPGVDYEQYQIDQANIRKYGEY